MPYLENITEFLKSKKRPFISDILYFIIGIVEMLYIMHLYLPFSIHMDLEIANHIKMKLPLNDCMIFVNLICISFLLNIIWDVFMLHRLCKPDAKNNPKYYDNKVMWLTYTDILDLVSAVLSFLFIASVIVQLVETKELFLNWRACLIYFVCGCKFLSIIYYRYYFHYLESISKEYLKDKSSS